MENESDFKRYFNKEDVHYTNIHTIYVNSSNDIEKIIEEIFYMSSPNHISKEEIFEILKRNSIHNDKKYRILSILKFAISENDITGDENLTPMKNIEAITFSKALRMFHDLTDLIFIFYEKENTIRINTTHTKKIYLHKQKTKSYKHSKNNLK